MSLGIAILTLTAVIWYATIAHKQWGEMIRSNALTKQGLVETRRVSNENMQATEKTLAEARETNRLSQEGLRLTRHASEMSQRAWVTVKTATLTKPLTIGEAPVVTLQLVNSGKSPAVDVIVGGGVFSRAAAERGSDDITGTDGSRMVIGPDTVVTVPLNASEPVTRQGQIDAIRNGPWRLYAQGIIMYFDVFQRAHKTRFCFKIWGKELDARIMGACDRWNTAD